MRGLAPDFSSAPGQVLDLSFPIRVVLRWHLPTLKVFVRIKPADLGENACKSLSIAQKRVIISHHHQHAGLKTPTRTPLP